MEGGIYDRPRLLWAGDAALTVEFGDAISAELNERVLAFDDALRIAAIPGIIETVPTYRSLMVHYDPVQLLAAELRARIERLELDTAHRHAGTRLWHIPVAYGGPYGIDLDHIAARHGLTAGQVVELHSAAEYRVYMIGFAPGFTYLGGLDARLHTPRRTDPRTRTPAGSVSIGGMQAAISSVEVPSGWHLLGRTPVRTFDLQREPPFLLSVGDAVRFEPIPHSDWAALDARAAAGEPIARCESRR